VEVEDAEVEEVFKVESGFLSVSLSSH